MKKVVRIVAEISEDLKKELRIEAINKDVTIKDLLTKILTDYMEGVKRKKTLKSNSDK